MPGLLAYRFALANDGLLGTVLFVIHHFELNQSMLESSKGRSISVP